MEKLLNKQMEEFIEILESDKDLTSEDVWTNHEKKEWFKLKQQELLKEAVAEERERVRKIIRKMPNATRTEVENETVICADDLLSSLDTNSKE